MVTFLRAALRRLRAMMGRGAVENEMQEEIRAHLERATERMVARGMSPADARAAARREFGNVTVIEEDARDARGARWVESMAADFRFALRYFSRTPLTTATIVFVLALGIGVNSALFSVIQAFTVRPAPAIPKDDAHVRIYGQEQAAKGARWEYRGFTHPELLELQRRTETFSAVAAWHGHDVIMERADDGGARRLGAEFVTPNYWSVLGVALTSGPGFAPPVDDTPDFAAVISAALSEELFGGPAAAIGQPILVNDVPVRIVGVAPPRFQGAVPNNRRPGLWLPLSARAEIAKLSPQWLTTSQLSLFGRLAPAVTPEQATVIAQSVSSRWLPDSLLHQGAARTARVRPMSGVPATGPDDSLIIFTAVGTIAILILLVACTNVSSLLVASAVGRRHEIAVRLSLGASRGRLLRQLVTESALLSVAGGAAGLLLYWWLTRLIGSLPTNVELTPDFGTIAFTMVFAIGTGILFGLSPALQATGAGVAAALKDSGTGATRRSRLQRSFVIAQIVFSQPLLVILATMLAITIGEAEKFPDASVADRVVSARFRPLFRGGRSCSVAAGCESNRPTGMPSDDVAVLAARIATQPGVVSVVPEAAAFQIRNIATRPEDRASGPRANEVIPVHFEGTAPGYLELLQVPILLGRAPILADTAASEAAIVIGSDLARALWGSASPIGKRLASTDWKAGARDSTSLVVVGVFDASYATTRGVDNRVYTAHGKRWRDDALLVRTSGPAQALVPSLREFIRAEAPNLPVTSTETLSDIGRRNRGEALQVAGGAAAAGALALLLASIGLYAVVSLAVGQRKREIGIRIALGGKPSRVAAMFFTSGVRLSAIALLIGLPLSVLGLKLVSSMLIAPKLNLFLLGLGIATVVLVVASAAAWLPARRAATVDPSLALRAE